MEYINIGIFNYYYVELCACNTCHEVEELLNMAFTDFYVDNYTFDAIEKASVAIKETLPTD